MSQRHSCLHKGQPMACRKAVSSSSFFSSSSTSFLLIILLLLHLLLHFLLVLVLQFTFYYWSQPCNFHLRLLTPSIFRSSTESNHLPGLPTRPVPSGLCNVRILQGSCSCILQRCLSHINLPALLTVTSGR